MGDRYREVSAELAAAPRRWLVTGAAGFIGSALVERLLELGQRVVGLDNFATGHWRNLDGFAGERFHFIEGDLRDLEACARACAGADVVLHQAALGSVPRSIADPLATHQANVDGFANLLVAARDAGVRRLVYASSSSVYGDATGLPQVEERTGRALSPYAASKQINELWAGVWQATYGTELVGLRYFNVFGRRQDPAGAYAAVIPRWIGALLAGQPCSIHGDGEQSRDFCYVDNVVQANLLAAAAPPAATGRAYNIACGERTSLLRLHQLLRARVVALRPGPVADPVHEPPRPGDLRHSQASIDAARAALGYQVGHDLETGLDETVRWFAARAG